MTTILEYFAATILGMMEFAPSHMLLMACIVPVIMIAYAFDLILGNRS